LRNSSVNLGNFKEYSIKTKQKNVGIFATTKLQAKRRSTLAAFVIMILAIIDRQPEPPPSAPTNYMVGFYND